MITLERLLECNTEYRAAFHWDYSLLLRSCPIKAGGRAGAGYGEGRPGVERAWLPPEPAPTVLRLAAESAQVP